MVEKEFKKIVASNLVYYRRKNGYTQLEVADKLKYSDKAISKWERGEALPDTYTLYQIALLYGTTLDSFLLTGRKPRLPMSHKAKLIITLLSSLIPWIVACLLFFLLGISYPAIEGFWLTFIFAIPVSAIVALILSLVWGYNKLSFMFASVVLWGTCLSIYYTGANITNMFLVFILAIPIQLGLIFWFLLKFYLRKKPD